MLRWYSPLPRNKSMISYVLSSLLFLPRTRSEVEWQYTTTWDRSSLFTYQNLGSSPINFVTPGAIGTADIVVNDAQVYQTMFGHGGSLSTSSFGSRTCVIYLTVRLTVRRVADSSALLLNNMKARNLQWSILDGSCPDFCPVRRRARTRPTTGPSSDTSLTVRLIPFPRSPTHSLYCSSDRRQRRRRPHISPSPPRVLRLCRERCAPFLSYSSILKIKRYLRSVYSFDDTAGDTSLSKFNINAAPSYVFSVIKDIMSINPYLRVHILPWSPVSYCFSLPMSLSVDLLGRGCFLQPGWMKDSGTQLLLI